MLGNTLREERERQNLSVNDIEQGTSIRALYIEAIENGEYDKMPGEVYTRGFIKNYANFLGLDGDAFAKQFTTEVHGAPPAAPSPVVEKPVGETMNFNAPVPEQKPEVKPVKPVKAEKQTKVIDRSINEKNHGSSGKLIVAAVVIIAALAGGAWSFLSDADNGGEVAKVNPPAQTQPVQPEPQQTPVANANPAPKADSIKIEAKFIGRCWTLATVDGQVVLEGVVEAGETISWEGKNSVNLRFGDAGAVELTENGKNLGIQGGVGEVVDKNFTR